MKRILTIAFLLITVVSYSQQYTYNPAWGVGVKRFVITEGDTTTTKIAGGLTVKNGILYIGNGIYWSMVTGSGGSTDSLIFATWRRMYKVNDSMKVVYNSLYNFTNGNGLNKSSLTFSVDTTTMQKKLSAGTGIAISGNTIYNTGSTSTSRVYAGNGLTNVNDSTLRTDTSLTATKLYVNYKDDIQQGFIDLRKLESDSTASSGYTRRDRALNIAQSTVRDSLNVVRSILALKLNISDTAAMLSKYRDTLNSHNSRIITNTQNIATNTASIATKEPSITASNTTLKYWNGYKNFVPLNKDSVGLSNVPNTDATNASNITSGTLPIARLDTGRNTSQAVMGGMLKKVTDSIVALRFVPFPDTTVTASYTLTVRDLGRKVYVNSASAVTISMPTTSTITTYGTGYDITVYQIGEGIITFAANSNTLNSFNTWLRSGGQDAVCGITPYSSNTYKLYGQIMP